MKYYKYLASIIALAAATQFIGCDDYDYDNEMARTDLTGKFSVKGATGNIYKAGINGSEITVKVNPFADVQNELSQAYPIFYLPMGATCSPSPLEPQDFTKEVKYTITSGDGKHQQVYTVNLGASDLLSVGDGYSLSRLQAEKLYFELGYPGEAGTGEIGNVPNGDILFFPAFCGDRLVGFSRVYAWGNNNGRNIAPDHSLAFKVWDATTLESTGETLNLGSLSPAEIVNITNDWKGHLVAATGGLLGKPSDIYYWTSLSAAPVKVGTLPQPVYTSSHEVDASMFIQVAGDITADAVVTYMPTKTSNGEHVAVSITSGNISDSRIISTGYPSNDKAWFQMISLFGTDNNAPMLVGETEGEGNGSVHAYLLNSSGSLLSVMPAHLNGREMSDGIAWWSGTGNTSLRGGARLPFVMAMMINGKPYSLVLTGYHWRARASMMSQDLATFIDDDLSYDFCRYEMSVLGAAGGDFQMTYGGAGCWYWDDENHIGRIAIWYGREGLATFLVSNYE